MRSAGIERLDDPGEVRERAGQAIHLVDNDQIDLPLPDAGQQILQGGAATVPARPFQLGDHSLPRPTVRVKLGIGWARGVARDAEQ